MRKTFGVNLNDENPEEATLMNWLNQAESASAEIKAVLLMYLRGEIDVPTEPADTTEAIAEAIDRLGETLSDRLTAAIQQMQVVSTPQTGQTINPTNGKDGKEIEPLDLLSAEDRQLAKTLLGAQDAYNDAF